MKEKILINGLNEIAFNRDTCEGLDSYTISSVRLEQYILDNLIKPLEDRIKELEKEKSERKTEFVYRGHNK